MRAEPQLPPAPALTQGVVPAAITALEHPSDVSKDDILGVLRALVGDHLNVLAFSVGQEAEIGRQRDRAREAIGVIDSCNENMPG